MKELTKKYICIITMLFIICSGVTVYANEQIDAQNVELTHGKLYYEQCGTLRYEGQLLNGIPHGYGKLYSRCSLKGAVLSYEGEVKNGKREGYGIGYSLEKLSYMGSWKNNRKHGFGVDCSEGILSYIGEFENGRHEGLGVMYEIWGVFSKEVIKHSGRVTMVITRDKDKAITPLPTKPGALKPEIIEKYKHRFGQEYLENKIVDVLIEEELKNVISSGHSNSNLLDKLKYIGDLKNSADGTRVKDGYGEVYNLDGDLIYAGGFREGKIDGLGATFSDNKLSYIGEFKGWHREGLGIAFNTYPKGERYPKVTHSCTAEFYVEKTEEGRRTHYVTRGSKELIEVVKNYPVNKEFTKYYHESAANYTLDKKQLKDMVEDYYSKWKDEFKKYVEEYLEEKSKQVRTTA